MKPIFCGNFEHRTRPSDLEKLFSEYGKIARIDMKSGFAFVYFEDENDARNAIVHLDNKPFGYTRRRLTVHLARGVRGRLRDGMRSNQKPTKTLFVINFDTQRTRERDLRIHFEHYGRVLDVCFRQNFAFVKFETLEDATKALKYTHKSKLLDEEISVEYARLDDDKRGRRYDSPRRDYGRHGPSRRSPSPGYRRGRLSPLRRSPCYNRYDGPYSRARSPYHRRYRSRSHVRRSRT